MTLPFLLDTNAVSDLVAEDPKTKARLAGTAPDRVFTSVIVRGEILFGIARMPPSKRRQDLEAKVRRVLGSIAAEPVPIAASEHYAEIKAATQSKGVALDENGLWIAATAVHVGATIVTRDADFGRVDGLLVADWSV